MSAAKKPYEYLYLPHTEKKTKGEEKKISILVVLAEMG
jgi:hypothetical protein